jgi:hypothetical protein
MPAHRGAALQLDRVVKTYGSGQVAVHALRGVDLEVGAGEFVVVLGPADRQDNRQELKRDGAWTILRPPSSSLGTLIAVERGEVIPADGLIGQRQADTCKSGLTRVRPGRHAERQRVNS